jgi:hypothetical protein
VPLIDEISLCKQYLNLELLRLGERLQIQWHIDKMPEDALVPPLILQPLIENAVYHGVQASNEPSEVSINIFVRRGVLHAILTNPIYPQGQSHSATRWRSRTFANGSRHFDAEAGLAARPVQNKYQVHFICLIVERRKTAASKTPRSRHRLGQWRPLPRTHRRRAKQASNARVLALHAAYPLDIVGGRSGAGARARATLGADLLFVDIGWRTWTSELARHR